MITIGKRPYKLCAKWRAISIPLPQYDDFFLIKKKFFKEFHKPFLTITFWQCLANQKMAAEHCWRCS
jgi:hypothetical protein